MARRISVDVISDNNPVPDGFTYLVIQTRGQDDVANFHTYIRSSQEWTKWNTAITGPSRITALQVGEPLFEGAMVTRMELLAPPGEDEE